MAQIKTGTVTITAEEPWKVTGTGTDWIGNVQAGNGFKIQGEATIYTVASVSDTVQEITLTAPYGGTPGSGKSYAIHRDYTDQGIPELDFNDVDPGIVVTDAFRKIDTLIASGGGGGGHTIEKDGAPVTQRSNMNFTGDGVSVSDDSGKTKIHIPKSKLSEPFPVSYYNDNLKFHGVVLDVGSAGAWDSSDVSTGPIIKIGSTYFMIYQGQKSGSFSASTSGGAITAVSGNTMTIAGHGFSNGDVVNFWDTTPPVGLSTYTDYYVVNATTDTLQLSATLGGAAITLTNTTTGGWPKKEHGRPFQVGLATSSNRVTWTKEANPIIPWPVGAFKIMPDDLVKVGSTYYLFCQIQKAGYAGFENESFDEVYYHTTDPTLKTWTYGGVVFSGGSIASQAGVITNIAVATDGQCAPVAVDGYYYSTWDERLEEGLAPIGYRTRMMRTPVASFPGGWTDTWDGSSSHIAISPEDTERPAYCHGNVMGTKIWQDEASGMWIILSSVGGPTYTGMTWAGLALHFSENIDGPYTSSEQPFWMSELNNFMEGRHAVYIAPDVPKKIWIFSDTDFGQGHVSVAKWDTVHNVDTGELTSVPSASSLAMWDANGNLVEWDGSEITRLPMRLNATGRTINAGLYNSSTRLTVANQDNSTQTDWLVVDNTNTPGYRGTYRGVRARGTLESPTVPFLNDYVLSLLGGVYDGSSVRNAAAIDVIVDSPVSANTAPLRISFSTRPTSDNAWSERLTIKSGGKVGINNTNPSEQLDVVGNVKAAAFIGEVPFEWKSTVEITADTALDNTIAGKIVRQGTVASSKTVTLPLVSTMDDGQMIMFYNSDDSDLVVNVGSINEWITVDKTTVQSFSVPHLESVVLVALKSAGFTAGWAVISSSGAASSGASGSNGYIQFAASSAFSSDSNLFWDNTNKRLGVGTSSPSQALHVVGIGQVERTGPPANNNSYGVVLARLTTSGDAADDFGPAYVYTFTDSGVTGQFLCSTAGVRGGADNKGDWLVRTNNAGSNLDAFRVRSNGSLRVVINSEAAPASATAAGVAGTVIIRSDYIYVCIATNTWRRAALSSW